MAQARVGQSAVWKPTAKPWIPKFKPGPPSTVSFNPRGQLSVGLQSLILFDNSAQTTVNWRDYASPTNSFVVNAGVLPSVTISPYGGNAFANTDTTGASDVLYNVPTPSTTTWTVSTLVKFNGTRPGGTGYILVEDAGFAHAPGVDDITGQWLDIQNTGAGKTGTDVSTFNTWTRVHLTYDGTTFSVYINGKLDGTNAQSPFPLSAGQLFQPWTYPISDFFFWGRTLSPNEVLLHASDPYGTTLKPARLNIQGGATSTSVTLGAGSIVFTGNAPSVTAGNTVLPGAGSLVFTGLAPSLTTGNSITPGDVGRLVFNGFAPNITAMSLAPLSVTPGTGGLLVRGFPPLITGASVINLGGAPADDGDPNPYWWDSTDRQIYRDRMLEDMRIELGLLPPRVKAKVTREADEAVEAFAKVIESDEVRTAREVEAAVPKYLRAYQSAFSSVLKEARKSDLEASFMAEVRQLLMKPKHVIEKDDEEVMELLSRLL